MAYVIRSFQAFAVYRRLEWIEICLKTLTRAYDLCSLMYIFSAHILSLEDCRYPLAFNMSSLLNHKRGEKTSPTSGDLEQPLRLLSMIRIISAYFEKSTGPREISGPDHWMRSLTSAFAGCTYYAGVYSILWPPNQIQIWLAVRVRYFYRFPGSSSLISHSPIYPAPIISNGRVHMLSSVTKNQSSSIQYRSKAIWFKARENVLQLCPP